jgi:hypothetical protein
VVVIGEPIVVRHDESGRVPRSAVKDTTTQLYDDLQRLFDEAQRLAGTPNIR